MVAAVYYIMPATVIVITRSERVQCVSKVTDPTRERRVARPPRREIIISAGSRCHKIAPPGGDETLARRSYVTSSPRAMSMLRHDTYSSTRLRGPRSGCRIDGKGCRRDTFALIVHRYFSQTRPEKINKRAYQSNQRRLSRRDGRKGGRPHGLHNSHVKSILDCAGLDARRATATQVIRT